MARNWIDRIVQFPRRFKDQNGNTLTLTPEPGVVTQEGTPVNAFWLNGIESDLADRMNGIAVYGGNGMIDPNLTTDSYILTQHSNVPVAGSFFHIQTFFYTAKSNTVNRAQIAIRYSGGNEMYTRYYAGSTWSLWKRIMNEDDKKITDDTIGTKYKLGINNGALYYKVV